MPYIEIGRKTFTEEDFSNGNHVDSFVELAQEVEYMVNSVGKAGSNSSVTIGTGSKTFVTDVVVPWVINHNIRAYDTSVSANYVGGKITAISDDGTSSTITLNVTKTGGSGTLSSWNLVPFDSDTVVGGDPLEESKGGWGTDNFEQGRINAELARTIEVIGISKSPDPTMAVDAKCLVDSSGLGGLFVGHENEVATKLSNTPTFSFETVQVGTKAYDTGAIDSSYRSAGYNHAEYVYTGSNQTNTVLSDATGKWLYSSGNRPIPDLKTEIAISTTTFISSNYFGRLIRFSNLGNITVTLDHDGTNYYYGKLFYLWHNGVNPVTLQIQSSRTFQYLVGGAAYATSVTLVRGDVAFLVGTSSGYLIFKSAPLATDTGVLNGVMLYRTSNITIPDTTTQELVWQAESYDTASSWASGARITVPTGYTKAKATLFIDTTGGAASYSLINVDDVNQKGTFTVTSDFSAGLATVSANSGWMTVDAGDRLAIQVSTTVSSDVTIGYTKSFLSVEFLR